MSMIYEQKGGVGSSPFAVEKCKKTMFSALLVKVTANGSKYSIHSFAKRYLISIYLLNIYFLILKCV